jgi:hypothetical membrane protein
MLRVRDPNHNSKGREANCDAETNGRHRLFSSLFRKEEKERPALRIVEEQEVSEKKLRRSRLHMRISGLAGIAAPIIGLGSAFIATAETHWFTWKADRISSLLSSNSGNLIRTGFIAAGVLTLTLATNLKKILPDSIEDKIGAALVGASGIALSLIGVSTEAFRRMHEYSAIAFFLSVPEALLVLGIGQYNKASKKIGAVSMVAGAATLVLAANLIGNIKQDFSAVYEMTEGMMIGALALGAGAVMTARSFRKSGKKSD